MAKRNLLSAAQCKAALAGKYGDGAGLYLVKQSQTVGQWYYRFTSAKRRREMGLGPFPTVSLAAAREARDRWAAIRAEGRDPIEVRAKDRQRASAPGRTLSELTAAAFEAERVTLRDDGNAGRWLSPLKSHVLPAMGSRDVETLDQNDIEALLRPIWRKHPVTAQKAMNRLGKVLRYGAARGLRVDLNAVPLAKALLGDPGHVEKNIPAMPWPEVPAFYASLKNGTPTELALRLLILTAARSRPIRFAHVDQFDGDTWTIPGEGDGARQKGRKNKTDQFRVPLSAEAQAVVSEAIEQARDGYLFPGPRSPVISDMAMNALMRRRELPYRPHGFRSSFKTWASEQTNVPGHIIEMQLSHATESRVAQAYQRSDMLDQRRVLVSNWSAHVTGFSQTGKVVPMTMGTGGRRFELPNDPFDY